MNYSLAKELKETGFPATAKIWSKWVTSIYDDYTLEDANGYKSGTAFITLPAPTLSELIEACGIPFFLETNPQWCAGTSKGMNKLIGGGSTPEEAVARLWLALNKEK